MSFTDFDNRRLEVYLASLSASDQPKSDGSAYQPTVICSAMETKRHVLKRHPETRFSRASYRDYVGEAQGWVRMVDRRGVFSVFPNDNRGRFRIPTLVKSRSVGDRDDCCILLPLDRTRHWKGLAVASREDIEFTDKDDRLVWRGITTGTFKKFHDDTVYSSRFHVASLETRMAGIDVAYNEVVQITEETCDIPLTQINLKVRPPMSIGEQLQSKFLLSLEGNDVATGLKWMLYSNSVVIMPEPTCETWACESALVPFEHYVPICHDLSDIEEVYEWCLTHQSDCEQIAHNGRRFIEAFLNDGTERELCRAVVSEYLSKTHFEIPLDFAEHLVQYAKAPFYRLASRFDGGPRFLLKPRSRS